MRFLTAIAFVLLLSSCSCSWTVYTPGDTVDNSTQSLLVPGYHPEQPFAFNHKRHASDRGMPCEYCHTAARVSATAGIPPLNLCIGCHKVVNTDVELIKKLTEAYNNNTPIAWVKVHDLPDHVHFDHSVHVLAKDGAGKPLLQCQTCHGEVQGMATAEQYAPLQMSWCVDCHNKQHVPAQATPQLAQLNTTQKGEAAPADPHTQTGSAYANAMQKVSHEFVKKTYAPISCNTCHF